MSTRRSTREAALKAKKAIEEEAQFESPRQTPKRSPTRRRRRRQQGEEGSGATSDDGGSPLNRISEKTRKANSSDDEHSERVSRMGESEDNALYGRAVHDAKRNAAKTAEQVGRTTHRIARIFHFARPNGEMQTKYLWRNIDDVAMLIMAATAFLTAAYFYRMDAINSVTDPAAALENAFDKVDASFDSEAVAALRKELLDAFQGERKRVETVQRSLSDLAKQHADLQALLVKLNQDTDRTKSTIGKHIDEAVKKERKKIDSLETSLNAKIEHFAALVEEAKSTGADRISEIQAAHNSAMAQMKEIKQHLSEGGKISQKELEAKLESVKSSSEDLGSIKEQVAAKMTQVENSLNQKIDRFTSLVEKAKSSGADRIAEIELAHNSALAQLQKIQKHLSAGGKITAKELEERFATVKSTSIDLGAIKEQVSIMISDAIKTTGDEKFQNMESLVRSLQTLIETKSQEVEELRTELVRIKMQRTTASAGNVDVEEIVNAAIEKIVADRTDKIDHAIESTGGMVVAATETYRVPAEGTGLLSYFRFLYYPSKDENEMLRPSIVPGSCWPMKGSSGWAVIQLSSKIVPTEIAIEHPPPTITPNFNTAPRILVVYGIEEVGSEKSQTLLGKLEYLCPKTGSVSTLQTFPLPKAKRAYSAINVTILSNHGNSSYTCIYRVRVHGNPVK